MVDDRAFLGVFISTTAALFGLVVGSFANVVIYRLPLEQSIVFPASRCPHCGVAIKPWQNIPMISWILLRGRCASCRAPISSRYPLVEAIHGVGFAAVVAAFGFSLFTPVLLLLFFGLVVLAFIDWDHQILPDRLTLPLTAIGLASSTLPGAIVSFKEAALAAGLGYLGFFLVAHGYSRLRGIEGLGMGDWKLAAMMGAFLGGRRLLLAVFLASLSGMIYGLVQATRRRVNHAAPRSASEDAEAAAVLVPEAGAEPVGPVSGGPLEVDLHLDVDDLEPDSIGKYKLPFGTFLAASAIFVLFRGEAVLEWYGSLFRF